MSLQAAELYMGVEQNFTEGGVSWRPCVTEVVVTDGGGDTEQIYVTVNVTATRRAATQTHCTGRS